MLLCCWAVASAQEFIDLTARQVRIDSLLPVFTWQKQLGPRYADSTYTVSIEYPEFIDMSQEEVKRCLEILTSPDPSCRRGMQGEDSPSRRGMQSGDSSGKRGIQSGDSSGKRGMQSEESSGKRRIERLPELPVVTQHVGVSRKQGVLEVSLVPLVYRDGRYQKLVSFKLNVQATAVSRAQTRAADGTRYADHSVLSEGNWAKIRIPESGVYQLTDALVKKAGFSDPKKVKIFGYGGALQPEVLTGDYLTITDDLQEVPTATVDGRRLFYATGSVTWESATALTRIRNPYSDYGYYFLTESDTEPLTVSAEEFAASVYPANEDYHQLYEVDDYSWYHGGRNLFQKTPYTVGTPQEYTFPAPCSSGTLALALSYGGDFAAQVSVNDSVVGDISVRTSFDSYTEGAERVWTYRLDGMLGEENTVRVTQTSGAEVRLDYCSMTFDEPFPQADYATATLPEPEYVYRITNQDHHADESVDMIILIPTSQEWLSQAERIKALHEQKDGLTVRIVPADELFNEFSSGTPDANAYRRYLKMFYDRAESDAEVPRYLLLFGDGAWDNRMLTAEWKNYSPDDFLLCYESDNSFSHVNCYVSDDYFCLLDDDEAIEEGIGSAKSYLGKPDVAVGRLAARSLEEATVLVDKIVSYANNEQAGAWQNTVCVMGDDGNNNSHMSTADRVATLVENTYPGYVVQKIYWDAYTRTTSSTGNSYPDVTRLIKERMNEGALIMNYSGHGAAYALSHEMVLKTTDFAEATSMRLPLWLTASCDIMPFDGQEDNIGETAMSNKRGGAIAFFGTTRTVYANYNEAMNPAFTRYVLGTDGDSPRMAIGEAVRRAKCDLVDMGRDTTPNKLQYTLLGDPALTLATPTIEMTVDSIGGRSIASGETVQLAAGSVVTVKGHIGGSQVESGFNGVTTVTIRDAEETITCRLNDDSSDGASTPFVYTDRTKTLYNGSDSVRNGRFSLTFAVPKDISYTEGSGLMTLYAVSSDKTMEAHGQNESFVLSGSGEVVNDSIGPSIYCYLNSPTFSNGGRTNTTPYFVAELYDDSGINASGSSIGHDLELIIDGELSRTYNLNSYFAYDFGDYRSGTVRYSIPELSEGKHKLLFRAWDVMNNSSTSELSFEVVKGEAGSISVDCLRNSASGNTTFIITHDRAGSQIDVQLDIYDTSGRQLWRHTESGVSSGNVYTIDWDQTVSGGRPLMTGVYIYRISVSSDGGEQASQAKKLIVVGNK